MRILLLALLALTFATDSQARRQEEPEVTDDVVADETVEVDPCEAPVNAFIERQLKQRYPQNQEAIFAGPTGLSDEYSVWTFDSADIAEDVVAKVAVVAKYNADHSSCTVVSSAANYSADDVWPSIAINAATDACAKTVVSGLKSDLAVDFPGLPLALTTGSVGAKFSDGSEDWTLSFQSGATVIQVEALVKRVKNVCSVVASSYNQADQ